MLNTFIDFNKCLFRMRFPWPVWMMALMAVNMIGPLFFIGRAEARVVLAVFVISAGLMMALYASRGFSRILGAGHVLWLGLLPWLWSRYGLIQPDDWFAVWILAVIAINGLSLIIDAIDVVRYLRGDRRPTVSL